VVIISFPSNDVNLFNSSTGVWDYNKKETMDNLRLMFDRCNAAGVRCFITSTQPRNDIDMTRRTLQRELLDSIINNFGVYAVNFWDDLVTNDGQFRLRDDRRADDVHPNTLGHRFLYDRIRAEPLFAAAGALPLALTHFRAQLAQNTVVLKWQTQKEDAGSYFDIERSSNGTNFQKLATVTASGLQQAAYSWTDAAPLKGKSYYRLKIREPAKTSYSFVAVVSNAAKATISKVFATSSELFIKVDSRNAGPVEISITSISGAVVSKKSYTPNGNSDIVVPISSLQDGEYIVILSTADGSSDVKRFIKIK
jgi:hypothetical protein